MWTCPHCGCQNIASDLTFCPQCFTPRAPDPPAEPIEKARSRRKPSAAAAGTGPADSAPQDQTEGESGDASDHDG